MNRRRIARVARTFFLCVGVLLLPSEARAEPLFGWGENALEDRFLDGDVDEEDRVALRGTAGAGRSNEVGASDVHGQSWMSVVGFARQLRSGKSDLGAFVVVGLPLDRWAMGDVRRIAEPPRLTPAPAAPNGSPPLPGTATATNVGRDVAPAVARACVAATLRASGLGTDDARLDELVARARESAWLPETRMRAMRLWTDAAHTTTVAATDAATYYDALGANLVLELRFTWRFDRLLFAGDEPTIERIRLERQDARARLATRTLEALFAWQRALVQTRAAPADSPEAIESRLRAAEAAATLDVLTAGWFSESGGAR